MPAIMEIWIEYDFSTQAGKKALRKIARINNNVPGLYTELLRLNPGILPQDFS
jgi:hypothetical protein